MCCQSEHKVGLFGLGAYEIHNNYTYLLTIMYSIMMLYIFNFHDKIYRDTFSGYKTDFIKNKRANKKTNLTELLSFEANS